MDTNIVKLFIGSPIEVLSERQLIARLRADLERAGIEATLYANFFTLRRNERQIDLLVCLPWRTSHVEIKGLDQDLPVIARPNGPWRRRRTDGTEHEEGNHGKQTLDGTHAISDTMRTLAARGDVPDCGAFKKHIDGILCLWPQVPPGSDITVPSFVTVVGYEQLLERLSAPGPNVDWSQDTWAAFARRLSLYQPEPETPAEKQRRLSLDQVDDYRTRARAGFSAVLGPHIDTSARTIHGGRLSVEDIDRLVAAGGLVALASPSGTGKTSIAQHIAVDQSGRGRLVIWARCGEYEKGRLGDLLNRSAAPYSAARRSDLVAAATDAGAGVTVILDGLDECPGDLRDEFIGQVSAFRLRAPISVLVTTNVKVAALDSLTPITLTLEQPDDEARRAILTAHGSQRPELISSTFATPYELSIAATCEADLTDEATVATVHDAYIRRFARSEQVRAGLRTIATTLHGELRSALPQLDLTRHLAGPDGGGLDARHIDEVLDCGLLVVDRNRVRFRHALLARFLAAEALVHAATDGDALGAVLAAPANHELQPDALAIERHPQRRWDAIVKLVKPKLVASALVGDHGADCARHGLEVTRSLLRRAIDATRPDRARFEAVELYGSRWVHDETWAPGDRAVLHAAGIVLTGGLLVDQIVELFDATDVLCAQAIADVAGEISNPRSTAVHATYGQGGAKDDHGLPATLISYGCEMASMMRRFRRPTTGVALRFAEGAAPTSYGRLFTVALLSDPQNPDEQEGFADLLGLCWASGAYDIRLHALWAAEFFSSSPEPARTEIVEAVSSLRTDHWALSSSIVEVLASFGAINSPVTVEDIHDDIRATIAKADDPEACDAANTILSRRYDPEEIVGPYTEAIQALGNTERALLLLMAVRSSSFSMFRSHDLLELADLTPTGDARVDAAITAEFARRAGTPPEDDPMPAGAIAVAVSSVISLARFDRVLPSLLADTTYEAGVWHDLMSLVLLLHRDDSPINPAAVWARLRTDPVATAEALTSIDVADRQRPWGDDISVVARLLRSWPADANIVLTHVLLNPHSVKPKRPWLDVHAFAVHALGDVGNLEAAEVLRTYLLDPDLGATAARSIRKIHDRHNV